LHSENDYGLSQFLYENPGMSLIPANDINISIRGSYKFYAKYIDSAEISDTYRLLIVLDKRFPRELPIIYEIDEKIQRIIDNHINDNGSLCLGSPLRLKHILSENPNLVAFTNKCLVPFLYSHSYKNQYGKDFILGQLSHGTPGTIEDYFDLFKLTDKQQVSNALRLLGMRKRRANKHICPCGCGIRYGKCKYRFHLEKYRFTAKRLWFRKHLISLNQ
jgi:hypothetical protein